MSSRVDHRFEITDALKSFAVEPIPDAAKELLQVLGYASKRTLPISTPGQFLNELDPDHRLTERDRDAFSEITSLRLLFQFTDAELTAQKDLFDKGTGVETTQIQSYLFFAVELSKEYYTRSVMSALLRAINKPLPMPAIVLFKHGATVSMGIIHRRLNRRDRSRDVLEKVTLVKDIHYDDPIRAHVEILNDFAFENLNAEFGVGNFVQLHEAWQKKLDQSDLSERFYREIAHWYFWAHHQVADEAIRLPKHCDTEQEQSLFLIRLLTRVIFCWFLVEKRLIPNELFRERWLRANLKRFTPGKSTDNLDASPTFYHAILQNLFFGTLNMPTENRAFREKKKEGERYDKNYGITNLWRYEANFKDPSVWVSICERIPFLNGGLFDCLDDKIGHKGDNFLLDGFSDNPKLSCLLPNDLFFGPERTVDLSKDYGEEGKKTARSKKAKVRGLVEILSRYKFTVEENTPLEEEIALDPELLGKVFEKLLASYNEDTKTTARKALGAFYTPREIVSYMVDESLKSFLGTQVPRCKGALEDLFSNKATLKEIRPDTRDALIAAIGRVKILDPACGSGAFPMGALHRLVDLLQKLDPDNVKLREIQRRRAVVETEEAFKSGDREMREQRLKEINDTFEFNSSDYGRKLYLIENSIYGVDIQPIATQIAKLRFFIALVVEQKVSPQAPNLGVLPLPNLETRIVAADTLIPIEKSERDLFSTEIGRLRAELAAIRHQHFNARSPSVKRKWREADAAKRKEIADYLDREHTIPPESVRKLAAWDPYDQNTFAPFFDPEWMFGLPVGNATVRKPSMGTLSGKFAFVNDLPDQKELVEITSQQIDSGFDIVIGNPPYVRQEKIKHLKSQFKNAYPETYTGTADLYVYFYDCALRLLRAGGTLSYITSNSFLNSAFGEKLRHQLSMTTRLIVLVDFAEANVFTAITEPCILIAVKGGSPSNSFKALRWDQDKKPENFVAELNASSFNMPQDALGRTPWQIEVPTVQQLLKLLSSRGKPLGEFVANHFFYGIKTGLNEAFILDQDSRELIARDKKCARYLKPFLRGKDLRRWRPEYGDQWLIVIPSSENATHPWSGQKPADAERIFQRELPAIFEHFKPLRTKLIARADQGHYYWELRSCAYYAEFSKPKVIYQEINRTDSYAFDDTGLYMNNKLFMLPEAPIWLVGVLNSPITKFFLHRSTGVPEGGFLALQWPVFSPLPVAEPTIAQTQNLVGLVNIMRWLTSHSASDSTMQKTRDPLMVSFWERVLNGLVYELYLPEEVHGAGLRLFDLVMQAELPDIYTLSESQRLPTLREKFEELYDPNHPLRIALDKLQTLDTVRIIEGKA